MTHAEFNPEDDLPLAEESIPDRLPAAFVRRAGKEAVIDRKLLFANLEHAIKSKGLLDGPALFVHDDYEENKKTKILTIPIGGLSVRNSDIVVAINTTGPHNEPALYDLEQLHMNAYALNLRSSTVVETPARVATKHKTVRNWPVKKGEFGPFIQWHRDCDALDLRFIDLRHDFPRTPTMNRRVSVDSSEMLVRAETLMAVIDSLQAGDKRELAFTAITANKREIVL